MPAQLFASTTPTGVDTPPDLEAQEQRALLRALLVTVEHYFGGFTRLFGSVSDPRQPALITYPVPMVRATGVLMPTPSACWARVYLLRFGARRQIQHWLRHNTPSAAKFEALFAVANCPHGDTLNNVYARLAVDQVQEVVTGNAPAPSMGKRPITTRSWKPNW